jgi:hypothetical protein
VRYLYSTATPDVYGWTRGTELLAAAGVPVHPLVPGALVYVTEDPRGSGRAPLWVLVAEKPWEEAREVPDDAVIVGKPRPLLERDLEVVRAAALAEVGRVAALRAETPVNIPGYPPLGVGAQSRADWGSLLDATHAAEGLGLDPVTAGVYPVPFPAKDGSTVTLSTPSQARQLLLALFAAGNARKAAADAAAKQIRSAPTVAEVASALVAYLGET